MGQLAHFDIKRLAADYGCTVFVETGTGSGVSLAHARTTGVFDQLYSIEVNADLHRAAKRTFADCTDVRIFHGESRDRLDSLLDLLTTDDVMLFWLDAHFPGADYGLAAYEAERDDRVRMPLRDELAVIKRHRAGALDVLLIDDARLLVDGAFGSGPLPDWCRPLVPDDMRGVAWIQSMFADTHVLNIDFSGEGYLSLIPK